MTFERGSFVALKSSTDAWKDRIGCVLTVAKTSKWKYKVAILPIKGETMNMQVKVREDQVEDYNPERKYAPKRPSSY